MTAPGTIQFVRHLGLLLCAFFLWIPACRSVAERPEAIDPAQRRCEALALAVREFLARGTPRSEEILGSGGEDAAVWLRPLKDRTEGEMKLRVTSLLLSSGEDMGLTVDEEVKILLFDLTREEPHPFAALRALGRLREMGPSTERALRGASREPGAQGDTARRLLARIAEESR